MMRHMCLAVFAAACNSAANCPPSNPSCVNVPQDASLPDGVFPGSDETAPQSGTRIKMVVGKTADGARVHWGWFDAQRGENCGFGLAGDGKYRCLPSYEGAFVGYYADTQCMVPLAYTATSCTTQPRYAVLFQQAATACNANTARIFPITGRSSATTVFTTTATGCSMGSPPPQGIQLFTIGVEIPPTDFAEMTFGP